MTTVSEYGHWADDHITLNPVTGKYTRWDESGAGVVKISANRDEVLSAMEEHAKRLEEQDK